MSLVLQIIGVIALVIIAVALLFGATIAWKIWRAVRGLKRMAAEVQANMDRIYGGPHEYRKIGAGDFPDADWESYDAARREFETAGFNWVADMENLTLSEIFPEMRTFMRAFNNADGLVGGGFYIANGMKIIDLETELADGTFIVTSTAAAAAGLDNPEEVDAFFFEGETPLREVLAKHGERLAASLIDRPDAYPIIRRTYDELLESGHRLHALKCKLHQERGGITAAEIERIAGDMDDCEDGECSKGSARLLGAFVEAEKKERSGD